MLFKPDLYLLLAVCTLGMVVGQATHSCPMDNPSRCSCAGLIVDCSSRGHTVVPTFHSTSFAYEELRLDNNLITNITDNAFQLLSGGLTSLYLYNNRITLIEPNAFHGLEPSLLVLDLRNNNMHLLPTAIGELSALERLDVAYNPINEDGFTEDVLRHLGNTLKRFDFGSDNLTTWPTSVRHLQALEFMNVTGGSFFTLPPDAFHGFEGTLTTLAIQDTSMIAVPLALSRLRYLDRLYLDHNHEIRDSGILIPSFGGSNLLNNLKFISLRDDNLTVFPYLLQLLHSVTTLVLDSNRLAFVSDKSVQVAIGTSITNLSMRNCSLTRVPGALSKLTNLTSLDLSFNNIHSFENSDFDGMVNLNELVISNNPVEYIAHDCFRDLLNLTELNLRDTSLNSMPEAIMSLRRLDHLIVPFKSMECTCNIVWLKVFIDRCAHGLKIEGSCETIESGIQEYLANHIPKCPNYATFNSAVITC